jgi:hypothetical protein
VFTVSTDPDDSLVRRRVAVLGEVDVVRADDDGGPRTDLEAPAPAAVPGPTTPVGASLRRALVLAVRIEAAAAYLQLSNSQASGGRE